MEINACGRVRSAQNFARGYACITARRRGETMRADFGVRVQSNGGGRRSSSAKLSAVSCSVSASSRGATTWSAFANLELGLIRPGESRLRRLRAHTRLHPDATLLLPQLSFSVNCPRSIRSDLSSMFPVAHPICLIPSQGPNFPDSKRHSIHVATPS